MRGKYGVSMTLEPYSKKRIRQIEKAVEKKYRQPGGTCEWTKYDKDGNIIDQGSYYDKGYSTKTSYRKGTNRGMRIWINKKKKIKKKIAEASKVTDNDKNIDRYIRYRKIVFDTPVKRMHKVGSEVGIGHQIKNRCYTANGTYHLVNMKTFKILEIYNKEMPLESRIIYDKAHIKYYKKYSQEIKPKIEKKDYKEEIFTSGNIECHKLTYEDGRIEYKRYDKVTGNLID